MGHADAPQYLKFRFIISNEKTDNKRNIIVNLGNIGNVYSELNEYNRALEYYQKALKFAEAIDNKRSITINTGNIGTTYAEMRLYPLALEYHHKALELAYEIDNKQFIANNTNGIGLIYLYTADYPKALDYLEKALDFSKELNDKLGIAINFANIGNIYATPDFDGYDFEKAEDLLLQAITIHQELGTKKEEYDARKTLIDLYKYNGNIEKGFYQLEYYHQLYLEVQSEEAKLAALRESMNRKLLDLERDKEAAEREREIEYLRNVELAAVNEQVTQQNIKLEWLNKEKNEFLGIASHDLKNPLAGIVMSSELILQYHSNFTMEMVVERVAAIKNAALRMKEIVSNILDINAIESGAINLHFERVDVVAIVNQIIHSYNENLSSKSLQLHFSKSHTDICRTTDRSLLYSVIDNIFSNAIKYSPMNKNIWVNIVQKEYSVLISIRDEGQGLTANDMQKLFGKFSKLSARPTAGEHSTGLGLSIVKKIAEMMNAKVWAESEGKDKGATFVVELNSTATII